MAKPVNNGSGGSTSYKSKTFEVSVTASDSDSLTVPDFDTFGFVWKQGGATISAPVILGASNDFLYLDSSLDKLDGYEDGIYGSAYGTALTVNGGKGSDQLIFLEDGIDIQDGFFSGLLSFETVKLADGVGSTIYLCNAAHAAGILEVSGGTGDDGITFGTAYNSTNVTVSGGLGDDNLGTAGGNDVLSGGLGNDELTGGGGADQFVFKTALDGTLNVDLVTDFSSGDGDKIVLDDLIFVGLPVAEVDFFTYVQYDSVSGVLSFDSDGVGANSAVAFAQLGDLSHPASVAFTDFIIV
jgi:Ca2+-binding RTX toxin-like protein